jgi:hypothetical protein
MATIVYEYGLQQPTLREDEVNGQIALAHYYYNAQMQVFREELLEVRAAQAQVPQIAAYKQVVEAISEQIAELRKQKKLSKSHDKKNAPAPPPKGAIAALVAERKHAQEDYREAKKAAKEKLEELCAPINEKFSKKRKAVRSQYRKLGLYWGTSGHIDQCVDLAVKAAKEGKIKSRKNDPPEERGLPKKRRWTGRGVVAVQLQNGMPADRLQGQDRRVQVDPLDPQAFDETLGRGARRKLQYTTLRLRIGSLNDGKPVWAEWPLYMHRDLPEKAVIKWAKVVRKPWKQGFQYRWWLQLTLEVPDSEWEGRKKADLVAINVGWRKVEGGEIRAATWVDAAGNTGDFRLPSFKFRQRLEKANEIRGHRDVLLDGLKSWLALEYPLCSKWKSFESFYKLISNADLSAETREKISEWMARDKHLWWYERGCREGALKYRREQYRLFALAMADKYPVVVVENYDLRPIVTDEERVKQPAHQRVESSPSQLRNILRTTATRCGALVIDGESKLATQQCHLCGYGQGENERWDAAEKIEHTCEGCGATWDQDVNNARVLLARAKVMLASGEALAKKKTKKAAKFAKRHKKKEQPTV